MTRVVALIPDLLFGSNVLGALRAAGIEAEQVASVEAAADRLEAGDDAAGGAGGSTSAGSEAGERRGAPVLIVDLTGELDGAQALASLRDRGALDGVKTLAFYSHVEADTRERAIAAGFDLVVPRSRIAREGASLVVALADGDS